VKELEQYAYDRALSLLEKELPAPKEQEDYANKLRQVLVWHLQQHVVPKFIAKSFTTIPAN
jgi:hypothetical protein